MVSHCWTYVGSYGLLGRRSLKATQEKGRMPRTVAKEGDKPGKDGKARAVMLRAGDMAKLTAIRAKMALDIKKETGVEMNVAYATILHGLIEKEAKRVGVAA